MRTLAFRFSCIFVVSLYAWGMPIPPLRTQQKAFSKTTTRVYKNTSRSTSQPSSVLTPKTLPSMPERKSFLRPPLYHLDSPTLATPQKGSHLSKILASQIIRVCVRSDTPPFGYFLKRRLMGFDVDLAEQLIQKISTYYKKNLSIDWTIVTAGSRILSLQQKSCDMVIATFSYTLARSKLIRFSKIY
ncbi:MAG: transporter substrate-binding domain-containing protein, partial [Myxococcota bacterium]